jgi:hypothetical protein
MIVVMPHGTLIRRPRIPEPRPLSVPNSPPSATSSLKTECRMWRVITERFPTVPQGDHRVLHGRRADLNNAFAHLDWFSAIGVTGSRILGGNLVKHRLRGQSHYHEQASVEMLSRHGFAATFQESTGAHTCVNWRNYLYEVAPQLFR